MNLHISVVGDRLRVKQVAGFGSATKSALAAISAESEWKGAESAWYYPYNAGTLQGLNETAARLGASMHMDASLKARLDQVKNETQRETDVRMLMQRYIDDRTLPLAKFETSTTPPPYWFQSIAWHWFMRMSVMYLQFKPGLGKTRVGCDAIRGKHKMGQIRAPEQFLLPERESRVKAGKILPSRWGIMGGALVACPRVVLGEWLDQLKRWQGITAVPITGDAARKRQRAGIAAWVHLCSYESLESVEDNRYDLIIADEAHYLADEETNRFQRMMNLRATAASALALSGTPLSNMLKSLWAQYMWLDGGRTLGPSYEAYVKWYLRQTPGARGEMDSESAEDRVARAISRVTFPLTMKAAFPDKPEKLHQVIRVPMTKEQSQYYAKVRSAARTDVEKGTVSAPDMIVKIGKLLQITQGFVIDQDKAVQQFSSAKLTVLEQMLTGDGDFAKVRVAVWCAFKHDIARVSEMLTKHKIPHLQLHGDLTEKERESFRSKWNNDPTYRVSIGNIAMGIGINMHAPTCIDAEGKPQKCYTTVFYGFTWKVTQVEQAMDRVFRSDQTEHCLFRYLLSDDLDEEDSKGEPIKPMDVRIYERLQEKLSQGVRVHEESTDYVRGLLS